MTMHKQGVQPFRVVSVSVQVSQVKSGRQPRCFPCVEGKVQRRLHKQAAEERLYSGQKTDLTRGYVIPKVVERIRFSAKTKEIAQMRVLYKSARERHSGFSQISEDVYEEKDVSVSALCFGRMRAVAMTKELQTKK